MLSTSLGWGKDIASITLVHWSGRPFHFYLSCLQLCLKLNENPTNKQKDYIILSSLWNPPVDGFPARLCYCLVAKSCPTLCHPLSPPGSSVHGIFQARILEWVAISFSRGSSRPRDWTHVSCVSYMAGRFFTPEPPTSSLLLVTWGEFHKAWGNRLSVH